MIRPMPALGVININIDPIFQLGPLPVHWYGVMYALAFLAAYRFGVVPYLPRIGLSKAMAERVCLWTIVAGLIGARLYYVVQQPNLQDYIHNPIHIIAVWEGGMAAFGAIIGAVSCLIFLAVRWHLPMWAILDGGALFGVIAQPIGRIGNIINGDILGPPSNLPWATAYLNPHAILQPCCRLGVPYLPAAAYEALATILIGVILFYLSRKHLPDGALMAAYIPLYAISQIIVFFWRASEPAIFLGLKQAQWSGIGMLVLIAPLFFYIWWRSWHGTRSRAWSPS